MRIETEAHLDTHVAPVERFYEGGERGRRGPGGGIARRDQAGIAPARLGCRLGLSVDHGDLMAIARQVIGGGRADDTGPQNHDPPCASLARRRRNWDATTSFSVAARRSSPSAPSSRPPS